MQKIFNQFSVKYNTQVCYIIANVRLGTRGNAKKNEEQLVMYGSSLRFAF